MEPCDHPGCMNHVTHPCEGCGCRRDIKMDKCSCICCGCVLEAEPNDNPMVISPVYNGLIFRSTGNYGSTIFDPDSEQREEILQIVICDDCMKMNSESVTLIHNIKRNITAETTPFTVSENK